MVDDTRSGGDAVASICPWCSASYTGEPERCPSCDATLVDVATDPALPGLTAIDAAAIVRSKEPVKRSRNRLLSWISGEYPEDSSSHGEAGALAPPDPAVRREILRLELEAEVANLQAEADALRAEVAFEAAEPGATPEDVAAATAIAEDLEAVAADLDETAVEIATVDASELAAGATEEAAAAADAAATGDLRPG